MVRNDGSTTRSRRWRTTSQQRVRIQTWGDKAGPIPEREFWETVISSVKEKFPHFLFIAEVYWDMEWELQQQGFDFCYDKRLYEQLAHGNANSIKEHLRADWDYQRKLVRFIENHDELRAMEKIGEEKSRAAAIIALTLPGARLIHEGQMEGYKLKLPVQLSRRQIEESNEELHKFYQKLLEIVPGKKFEKAKWDLCKVESIDLNNSSNSNIISYLWWNKDLYNLIVINYGPNSAKAHIRINQIDYSSNDYTLTELLTQKKYTYKGDDLKKFGLYRDLPSWEGQIFDIREKMYYNSV